ncbi:beta-taxilin isoform X2 [Thunnus thynnus]|uniref:beta-taxilin isoform X2 n=1 Tax=Thunnus thynnus TaxID=8237 RepID=UPI00352766CD
MMETSAKVVAPKPDVVSSSPDSDSAEVETTAPPAASDSFDPMEEFSRRLENIINTHGSAASLLDKQVGKSAVEAEMEKMKEEAKDDITVTMEKEVSVIMQSLNELSSPEKKLEDLVRKYAEMEVLRRCDEKKLCVQQQKLSVLLEQQQQLQAECRSGIVARRELETLCRELQGYYSVLREESLQSSRDDERKRSEITGHFQKTLVDIQAQIEQHSSRNTKLCRENIILTEKLESLMKQCETREQNLEKINKHRDLQCQLSEAKLQQANALLANAEEKHKREKEYLLVQAADWKLQAQALKEQDTVMQAQLHLYSQKFEEFQETLAKSNEIFARFKTEMDNMSEKMKKLEKESNVWKTRFENCNKALNDMMEERAEKNKEYDMFVLKIQKLELLCRALQDERKILYDKIKDVRHANSNLPSRILSNLMNHDEIAVTTDADESVLTSAEPQEPQKEDPVLTEDIARLNAEQAKLQELADSLLATPIDNDEEQEDLDFEEDIVASAFAHFHNKSKAKQQAADVQSDAAESVLPQEGKAEEAQKPDVPPAEEKTSETTPTDPKPEAVKDESQVEVKPDEEIQQQHSEETPEPEKIQINPPTDKKPEAVEILEEAGEVKPAVKEEGETVQQQPEEPAQVTEAAPTKSEPAPVSENTPQTAAVASNANSSNANSSKKQAPKKKKRRNGKNAN